MWKRRVDGGSVSGGRITLLLRIKWVCMREKARDIFCRRELLASAAFDSLPHLFIISSQAVKLVTVKRTFLYTPFFSFFFCLVLGWSKGCTHVAKRKTSGWPCWRTLETFWLQDQVSCHVLIAFVCVHKLFSLTCRHIQSERVYAPSTGKKKEKFALQFNKTFSMVVFYVACFFCYFCIPLIDTSMQPHCLSSAETGFPCTPYGPLSMLYEAKALSTTIWLKKDWPHFLFSAVGTYDHKLLFTNSVFVCTQPNDC